MQQFFVSKNILCEDGLYNDLMHPGGRPAKHPRSDLGNRIAQAREAVGLAQIQLAHKMGVTQQVVASWERKATAIRSDTLIKMAKILNVSSDELLGVEPPKRVGPSGRVRQIFESVSKLSRRQQQKIIEVVEALVSSQKI